MTHTHVQITTTFEKEEEAGALAHVLVDRGLAACAQVLGPIQSVYRWNGAIEEGTEWMCLAKTSLLTTQTAVRYIKENHPYDNPEIVVTPIVGGSPDYLRWLSDETSGRRR